MRTVKWTTEGMVKARKREYSMTSGTRQMPGVCWYSVKCRGRSLKQGGTAIYLKYTVLDNVSIVKDFFVSKSPFSTLPAKRGATSLLA